MTSTREVTRDSNGPIRSFRVIDERTLPIAATKRTQSRDSSCGLESPACVCVCVCVCVCGRGMGWCVSEYCMHCVMQHAFINFFRV